MRPFCWLLICSSCAAPADAPSTIAPTAYSDAMLALAPIGYWRLDDLTDVMVDATGGANGRYHSAPREGDPGFDGTAVHFDGAARYGEVADRGAYSLTRAWDDFDRIETSMWGGGWTGSGRVMDGVAEIEAGVSDHAIDLALPRGNLQIQAVVENAVALVAGNARAELRTTGATMELHLLAGETELATLALGAPDGWWYLRCEFDGTTIQARAWRDGDEQPSSWLTAPTSSGGAISIHATGPALVRGFRAQTLGFSIHAAVRLDASDVATEQILGKGNHSGFTSSTDQEYHLRIDRSDEGTLLKGYLFSREGAHGAGQAFAVEPDRWYEVVVEFDPGDYHDASAGTSMYVDGVALPNGAGSRYRSNPCTPAHDVCWLVDAKGGDAPLRIGTSDGSTFFAGNIDEVALFDRLLTADEVTSLRR